MTRFALPSERTEVAAALDPETARVFFLYTPSIDPYYDLDELPDGWGCLGRQCFCRGSRWNTGPCASDLPEETQEALRAPRGERRGRRRPELTAPTKGRTISDMTRYLHTMLRITDPEKTRAFYEALGLEFRRDMDIVRNGEKEATNYFFGVPGQDEELEFTLNHDGRTYELGTAYGHVAFAVDDLDQTLAQLKEQGIEPEREPYRVREGGSRLCFVRDPDSYRIELIDRSGK